MLSFPRVIFIYEDECWRNLLPLVHLRPVFDLRCGRRTLLEKFQALYPREKLTLLVRPELAALTRELHPTAPVEPLDSAICNLQSAICNPPSPPSGSRPLATDLRPQTPALFLSARAILDRPMPVRGPEEVFTNGPEIVGFRVNPARLGPMQKGRRKDAEETQKRRRKDAEKTQKRRRMLSASEAILRFLQAERFCERSDSASSVRSWRLPERRILASVIRFPWNLIEFNEPELARELHEDAERTQKGRRKDAEGAFCERSDSASEAILRAKQFCGFVVVGNPRNLVIARSAQIDPGVVFDLRLGRVLVDERAQVRCRSVVAGPCYVGPGTVLDAALVRPGCSFGPDCRIGGEVEASIFLGHANKHHEGFIGHAVVGEWVNLGAMTTNSDLRNDYGEVKVLLPGKESKSREVERSKGQGTFRPLDLQTSGLLNTGLRKFGCIIGDHAKTAIGTLLNTGAVLGVFANWYEPGLSPKLVPDFAGSRRAEKSKSRIRQSRRQEVEKSKGPKTLGPLDLQTVGPLDSLLATARIVMSRRGVRLSRSYEQLVRRLYAREIQ